MFQSFARQLTAFLPNTYPIGEQDEDAEAKAKRHGKLKILLLENINVDASDFLKKQGYEVSYILLFGFRYGKAVKSKELRWVVGIGFELAEPAPDVWALWSHGSMGRAGIGRPRLGSWVIECPRAAVEGLTDKERGLPEKTATDPRSTTRPGLSPRRNSSRNSPSTRVLESGPRPKSPPRSLTPVLT